MKKVLAVFAIMTSIVAQGQNPFAEYGYEPKIATYSQGQFNEFFDQDTIVQIGSVLFNTNTNGIVAFVETDTVYSEATLEPDVVSRWMSPDPLAAKYAAASPYNFTLNNPIILVDPDGRYAVSVHYKITYNTLIGLGYSEDMAKEVAQMASVYADHPPKGALIADNIGHLTWNQFDGGIDYASTAASQAEENSMWHSMMSDAEAASGMTHKQAMDRGLAFGWDNIFAQKDGVDCGKLGQGLHALQDAYAHQGASSNEHLGVNRSSVKMLWNDMYGNTDHAELITKSAVILVELFKGNGSGLENGMTLDFSGMSQEQMGTAHGLIKDAGFDLRSTSQEGFFEVQKLQKDE